MIKFRQIQVKVYPILFDILSIVKEEIPNAIIAGGAVCDNILNLKFRDIDIFVSKSSNEQLEKTLKKFTTYKKIFTTNMAYGSLIKQLYEFSYKGYKGNLVVVENLTEKIESFDITFRQVVYDGKRVLATHTALEDLKKKKLSINSFNSPIITLARIIKFQKRYGYSVEHVSFKKLITLIEEDKERQIQFLIKSKYSKKTKMQIQNLLKNIV